MREFVECLNSNKVEYLIVGALAVSWHGFPRYSGDIDFFVRARAENAERVLAAIREFGFASLDITATALTAANKVIQLGNEPNRIDLMTAIVAVSFEDAWASRVAGKIDDIPVNLIGLDALLRNKRASGQYKDRIDIEALTRSRPSG